MPNDLLLRIASLQIYILQNFPQMTQNSTSGTGYVLPPKYT